MLILVMRTVRVILVTIYTVRRYNAPIFSHKLTLPHNSMNERKVVESFLAKNPNRETQMISEWQPQHLIVAPILNFMKSTAQEKEKQKKSTKISSGRKFRYVLSVNGKTF